VSRYRFGIALGIGQKDTAEISLGNQGVPKEKISAAFGVGEKGLSLLGIKKCRFGSGQAREDPKKTPLGPGIFVGADKARAVARKAVKISAVFFVKTTGEPKIKQIFG
jgi:hypothetical protein